MQGDNQAAIEFLKLQHPNGPWVLTAIATDRKFIKTDTFGPETEKECIEWLSKYNGQRNIYWHVNPPMGPMTKKAEREDIRAVVMLHVDIDPRAGEDLQEERERALRILNNPPQGLPPPTTIVFSGGGYQAFWHLQEPIPIDGDLGRAETAKLYNMNLELAFGADNCHNIDRIMRLPGTINIPDPKKLKKGRKEEMATLVSHDPAKVYSLSKFPMAPKVQAVGESGIAAATTGLVKVSVSSNIRRLSSVDELEEFNVPDRVKVVIVQGHDPDNPKQGDNSRSQWLFDCLCNLVRCQVPDDMLYSIITDPDFGIAASVIDKGAKAEQYALRQIERAKEHAIDPELARLNAEHAVIENIGGKCRVVEEVMDHTLERTRLARQSFEDFRNRYMNKFVKIGTSKDGNPIYKPLGQWWLTHQNRRQYKTIVFAPGREITGAYNLWKGFAVAPKHGECDLYLAHIRDNICRGNEEHYQYLIKWMARCVQKPDSPGQTAIVLRGKQGTGKSLFVKQFGALFGRHFMQVADAKHMVGSFNSHLRDCILLFGDEAFYAGDKKHESVLKMLVTEEVITIEAKGVDAEAASNFVHLILASNNQWVVPAGADERRFFVLDVGDAHKQDTEYFSKVMNQLNNGGREALLQYLLTLNIKDFEVRHVPKTEALQEQKLLSMTAEQEWWYNKLEEGRILEDQDTWLTEMLKDAVFDDYVETMRRYNVMRRVNRTVLGKFLSHVCPGLSSIQKAFDVKTVDSMGGHRVVRRRPYFYIFPTLADCRARWDELYGAQRWETIVADDNPAQRALDEEIPF